MQRQWWRRPWRRTWTPRRLALVAVFGTVTTGMNTAFYLSIDRIPVGTAVAIEFLGPVAVAAARTRSRRDVAALGLAPALPLAAVIGLVYGAKGQDLALEALAEDGLEGLQILFVGPGDTGALVDRARRLGVDRRVAFVGPRDDVPSVLAASDLLLPAAAGGRLHGRGDGGRARRGLRRGAGGRAPMKLLHVLTTLDVGGAEMHVLKQVQGQAERGHQVRVLYLKGEGTLAPDFGAVGAEAVRHVPAGPLFPLRLRPDLANGTAGVRFRVEDTVFTREVLCSVEHGLCVRITSSRAGSIDVSAALSRPGNITVGAMEIDEESAAAIVMIGRAVNGEHPGVRFRGSLRLEARGDAAEIDARFGALVASGADEVTLYFDARTDYEGGDVSSAIETPRAASELGYDALKRRHIAAHRELFDRCALDLGGTQSHMIVRFRQHIETIVTRPVGGRG